MIKFFSLFFRCFFLASLLSLLLSQDTHAILFSSPSSQSKEKSSSRGKTNYPLPRFVSLKANRVNLRKGPHVSYSVEWLYTRAGLPVEILQEYDNWRRIRDWEGIEGWVHQSLLSGKRTGIVAPWKKGNNDSISLFYGPQKNTKIIAFLEPGLVGKIKSCNGSWCNVIFGNYNGWIEQSLLWGAYPNETIPD